MKKIVLVLLLTVLQVFSVQSQDGYRFRTLSPDGGFYFDGVKQIQQDGDGFIWVLMDHDLYRFDGYQYKRYYTNFTNLDKSIEWIFKEMAVTSSGYFFINTNNGLYSYDKTLDSFEKISGDIELVKVDSRDNI